MMRKGGGIEDSPGSKGFVLDRTKGANCGCIIRWEKFLREIEKKKEKERKEGENEENDSIENLDGIG